MCPNRSQRKRSVCKSAGNANPLDSLSLQCTCEMSCEKLKEANRHACDVVVLACRTDESIHVAHQNRRNRGGGFMRKCFDARLYPRLGVFFAATVHRFRQTVGENHQKDATPK